MTCRGSDTEMTGNLADLEPNGNLIDASFDGYKLSLDPLATYQVDGTPETHQWLLKKNFDDRLAECGK